MSLPPMQPQSPQYPYAVQPAAIGQRRKRNSTCLALTIVGVVLGGFFGLCVCGGLFFAFYTQEMPVSARDRQVVVDGSLIADFSDEFTPQASKESLTKSRYLDGSVELVYEYDDEHNDSAPYIMYAANFEKKRSDANLLYRTEWEAAKIGVGIGGGGQVTVSEHSINLGWGDRCVAADVLANGQPAGNLLAIQSGNTIVVFMIAGLYFDESALRELLLPVLTRLDSYEP